MRWEAGVGLILAEIIDSFSIIREARLDLRMRVGMDIAVVDQQAEKMVEETAEMADALIATKVEVEVDSVWNLFRTHSGTINW